MCNLCWSVAVLDLQQYTKQVLLLVQACCQQWGSVTEAEQQQLYQVHWWLLDCSLGSGQGLGGLQP